MAKSRPVAAIDRQKQRAKDNRAKIFQAIADLTETHEPVTINGVARKAGVSAPTVRQYDDVKNEINKVREHQLLNPRVVKPEGDGAKTTELIARWKTAQAQVKDLTRQLNTYKKATHQALGKNARMIDPDDLTKAQEEITQLRIDLMNAKQENTARAQQLEHTQEELTDAHALNREYFQELNLIKTSRTDQERNTSARQLRRNQQKT